MKKLVLSLALTLLLLLCSPCFGQGTVVNHDSWTCSAACSAHTLASAAASAHLVFTSCTSWSPTHRCGVTPTSSPSYTWTCDDTGTAGHTCYICPGTNTSGVTSITWGTAAASAIINEVEVSNIASTSCKDVSSNGAENTGSTWATNSITTTNALDFILSINNSNTSATGMSFSAPYTSIVIQQGGSVAGTLGIAYNNVSSTGANSSSGNQPTGSSDGFADIIAFKAITSGGCNLASLAALGAGCK